MFKSPGRNRELAKQKILSLFSASERPVLVDRACIELGYCWPLKDTDELFKQLECVGEIREITLDEGLRYGITYGYMRIEK